MIKQLQSFFKRIFTPLKYLSGIAMAFLFIVVINGYYQNSEVTVIALKCIWAETSSGELNSEKYYLIKKKRSSTYPESFYRGSHLITDKLDNRAKNEIYKQWSISHVTDQYYYFNTDPSLREMGHVVDRNTLDMQFVSKKTTTAKIAKLFPTFEHDYVTRAKCEEITEEMFFTEIRKKVNGGQLF